MGEAWDLKQGLGQTGEGSGRGRVGEAYHFCEEIFLLVISDFSDCDFGNEDVQEKNRGEGKLKRGLGGAADG